MEAKYNGIHLDYFKPELSHQAFEADPAYDSAHKNEAAKRSANAQDRVDPQQRRPTFGYHTNQWSSDLNNDYLLKIQAQKQQIEPTDIEERNSLRLKQTKSMPISTKQSYHQPSMTEKAAFPMPHPHNDSEADSQTHLSKQEANDHEQVSRTQPAHQTDKYGSQGLGPMADSSNQLNQTILLRQTGENFFLDNSAQLEPDFKEGNHAFSSSDYKLNEKQFGILEREDLGGQPLAYAHGRKQMHATENQLGNKVGAGAKESRNIRQIISTIEKNKELSQLDLSLDLKNQMKQCSTTRRHAQQSREETFLFEQYGLPGNIVIHPQDRKRMQEPGVQAPQRPAKTTANMARTKNMRSLKNLRSMRQSSQVEPQSPQKIENQPTLAVKKQQKSQSSTQKKKPSKSDRKSVVKKEVSLYHESDEKMQVTSFLPPEPMTVKKAVGRKKWMPSIENLNFQGDKQDAAEVMAQNNRSSSSSNSELPEPQLYSQIAPQPMDVQPLIHTSDQSARNSRESLGLSQQSSDSNISLIEEDKQPQDLAQQSLINQSDAQFHTYNSVNPVSGSHNLNRSKPGHAHLSPATPFSRQSKAKNNHLFELQSEILKHLLKEEDLLYKYATESIHEMQRSENATRNQGAESSQRNNFVIYQKLLIDASLEKPRFILFARQLQVSFMITRALIRVLPASLMTRFESKLKALCQNIHQSFLLIIDLILKQFQQSDGSHQEGYHSAKQTDIHQSIDFKLLRNITSKKIKSKDNFARTLTIFRQNNEINILYLKKIIKYILDSYSTDCGPFKVMAQDFQEIIRINYGSANTAAGTQSSNREESKAINYAILAQKEKEIADLHVKLLDQIETLISKPGVIINKSRQVANVNNVREPVHISPSKQQEDVEQQPSPQPQTYRHLSPMKTTKDNFASKDHEVLKRCKSTSKNIQINKNHLRSTHVQTFAQKAFKNREAHNMSMSSVLQKQRMNPVLSQNVYKGLNEMPTDNQRKTQQMTQQSDNLSQYSVPQNQPMRMHDLINASSGAKNMGVLAHRRNSKKQSISPNTTNAAARKGIHNLHQNASVMQLGMPGKNSALNYNENNYDQISDIDLNNAHSTERMERSSNYTFNAKSVKSHNNADSQQRTVSSQAQGTTAKTQSTLGAEYIRKKYDPQGYRRVATGTASQYSQKYQYRFNDRERQMKSNQHEYQRPQLKVKVGDNRQLHDLNSGVNPSSAALQQQPTPLVSQKRGSLGHLSPTKAAQQNTAGSPQKVNSLMKRYGSTNKLQTIPHPPAQQLGPLNQHDGYQSKAKMLPAQQQTPHQFNKNTASSGSKQHTSNSRVASDRKHLVRQQESEEQDLADSKDANNWGFMLQESKDFILRMSNDAHDSERSNHQYGQLPIDQARNQNLHSSNISEQPVAQITNVNNNINFYGTVVNHVYSPADTGRDSQHVERSFNEQFFSPKKAQQVFRQQHPAPHLKSAQPPSRVRLTTEKKSSQAYLNREETALDHNMFNEFILDSVDGAQPLQMQEPDSALFKEASAGSRRMTQSKTQSKFDELQYDQSILVDNLDHSVHTINNQKSKNSFAQSFLFEPSTPTLVSPEKRSHEYLHKSQRSIEREKSDYGHTQSSKKLPLADKSQQHQFKMHAAGTGIGSGLKNLKQKQLSLQPVPSKQSGARSVNDKQTNSRRKDVRKEVVKPQSRANMPQSQRDAPPSQQIVSQKSSQNVNYSQRNSFDAKMNETESPTKRADSTRHYQVQESIEPLPQQPPHRLEQVPTDHEDQIRQYNMNLLKVEEQTNISSSCKDVETPVDSRRDVASPEPQLKPATKLRVFQSEEIEEPEEKDNLDVSAPHDTSKVEAEIDPDDEQALIDAEYRRLRKLVREPYLPPLSQTELSKLPARAKCMEDVYTLVLDLDETLIHFEMDDDVDPAVEEPGYYLIRPGAIKFLNELSAYYELVVFTAAMPDYADWILDNVDRHKKISHRLYRQHSTPFDDYAMKDLTKLGRDMSKTMIIDNLAENFNQLTPLNGIWVESWYDDMDDIVLQLLVPFLVDIVKSKVDVRHILTDPIKEELIYKRLDEGKALPSIKEILSKYGKPK